MCVFVSTVFSYQLNAYDESLAFYIILFVFTISQNIQKKVVCVSYMRRCEIIYNNNNNKKVLFSLVERKRHTEVNNMW